MSWLYSRALVEAFLGENCLDGEQSAPLSGNPIQQAYCAPDKMKAFSRLSQFGMTYKPLTADRGQELLMSYLAGFRAKTSQPQEKVMDLTENEAECGSTWRAWLAKYDHDSCSWKTPQCSLLEEEQESLEILPRWGMTVNGLLWELPTLEPITNGTGCGSLENWPTPRSCSAMAATITPESAWNEKRNPNLETIVGKRMFPTPTCHDSKEGAYPAEYTQNTPTLATHAGGKLNPMWVEWLMGWPLGWTDLKPLEMVKYHSVPQPPSKSYLPLFESET